jgi:hypothetical protein
MGVFLNGDRSSETALNGIPPSGGGTDTSDATAGPENIEAGYTAYGAGGKITGAMDRYARAQAGASLTVPTPPTVTVTTQIL